MVLCGFGCDRRGDPYCLGHIAALSGPQRERGQQAMRGVQMAVEEINANSEQWVAGRKIAVFHADGRGDPETSAPQAMRLATVNRVEALIGGASRAEALQTAPVLREHLLVLINSSGCVGVPAVPEMFALGLAIGERARLLDRFLTETLKPPGIAVVTDGGDPAANTLSEEFEKTLRSRGAVYLSLPFYSENELTAVIEKLGKFDGAVVFAGSAGRFLRLRDGLRVRRELPELIFAGDESERSEIVLHAENAYFMAAYATAPSPSFDQFAKKFHEKFGVAPEVEAAAAYDATRLLVAAARSAKTFATTKLREQLAATKSFDGLMGMVGFDADQIARGPGFVIHVVQAKEKIIRRFDAMPATN